MGHRSDFSAFDRLMIVVVAFVFFAAVGFLLVLLLGKLGVLPNDDFMTEARRARRWNFSGFCGSLACWVSGTPRGTGVSTSRATPRWTGPSTGTPSDGGAGTPVTWRRPAGAEGIGCAPRVPSQSGLSALTRAPGPVDTLPLRRTPGTPLVHW